MKARLVVVKKEENFWDAKVSKKGTTFHWSYKNRRLQNIHLGLIGEHQVENASLALATLCELSERDGFKFDERKIREALQFAQFPGRGEIYESKLRDIIIDGAHNPQKIKAFIASLKTIYPDQIFDFLIAFSQGKNQIKTLRGMLGQIIPLAHRIMLTSFRLEGQGDMLHRSIPYERIIPLLEELNFKSYSVTEINKEILKELIKRRKRPLVITGSLYFIGSIYNNLTEIIKQNRP